MAEENKDDKNNNDGKEGLGSKLPLILTVVNLLVTVGIGAVVAISFRKEKNAEKVSDITLAEPGAEGAAAGGGHGAPAAGGHGGGGGGGLFGKSGPTMVTLEQFTLNLATSAGMPPRFARVVIAIELPSDDTAQELNQKMPQVRNSVIDLFNSKRPADLQSGEGRNYLKEEIRNALNSFLISGKVKGVYFSNFSIGG